MRIDNFCDEALKWSPVNPESVHTASGFHHFKYSHILKWIKCISVKIFALWPFAEDFVEAPLAAITASSPLGCHTTSLVHLDLGHCLIHLCRTLSVHEHTLYIDRVQTSLCRLMAVNAHTAHAGPLCALSLCHKCTINQMYLPQFTMIHPHQVLYTAAQVCLANHHLGSTNSWLSDLVNHTCNKQWII